MLSLLDLFIILYIFTKLGTGIEELILPLLNVADSPTVPLRLGNLIITARAAERGGQRG